MKKTMKSLSLATFVAVAISSCGVSKQSIKTKEQVVLNTNINIIGINANKKLEPFKVKKLCNVSKDVREFANIGDSIYVTGIGKKLKGFYIINSFYSPKENNTEIQIFADTTFAVKYKSAILNFKK